MKSFRPRDFFGSISFKTLWAGGCSLSRPLLSASSDTIRAGLLGHLVALSGGRESGGTWWGQCFCGLWLEQSSCCLKVSSLPSLPLPVPLAAESRLLGFLSLSAGISGLPASSALGWDMWGQKKWGTLAWHSSLPGSLASLPSCLRFQSPFVGVRCNARGF